MLYERKLKYQNTKTEIQNLVLKCDKEGLKNKKEEIQNLVLKGDKEELKEFIEDFCFDKKYEPTKDSQVFIDRRKQFMNSILGVFVYLRDEQKIEMKFSDLRQMNEPECLLRMLKETKEICERDQKTKEFSKYWIPKSPRKELLKEFSSSLGVTGWGEVNEQRYKLFTEQHFFIQYQFSGSLNILSNEFDSK